MANLTDTVSVPMTGKDIIQPPKRGPSIFEGLASVATTAFDMVQGAQKTQDRRAALARQRAEDATRAEDVRAGNDAAQTWVDVHSITGPDPAAQAASAAAEAEASRLGPLSAAARQGRASADAVAVRTEMSLRRLFRDHPNNKADILEAFNKYDASSSPLLEEYRRTKKIADDEEAAVRKDDQDAFDYGVNSLGLNPNAHNRNDIITLGRQAMSSEKELSLNNTRSQILERQTNISRQERDDARTDLANKTFTDAINFASPRLQAALKTVFSLVQDPSVTPEDKQKGLTQAVRALQTQGQLIIGNILAKAGPNMTEQLRNELKERLNGDLNNTVALLNGPLSDVQSVQRSLGLIENGLKIDTYKALPFYTRIRAAFGSDVISEAFVSGTILNEKTKTALQREFNGFDPTNRDSARVRLANMVSIIRGDTQLRSYNPHEAAQMLPGLTATMTNLVANENIRMGKDVAGNRAAVLAAGSVYDAALNAVPQWGSANLTGLLSHMINSNVNQAVFNGPANRDAKQLVWNVAVPSVTKTLHSLAAAKTDDPYFKVVYQNGRYVVQSTGLRAPGPQPVQNVGGYHPVQPRMYNATPNQATRDRVAIMNKTLDWLSAIQQRGFDQDVPPSVGLSDRERRDFYGAGVVPEKLSQHNTQEDPKAHAQAWWRNINQLIEQTSSEVNRTEFTPGEYTPLVTPAAREAHTYFTGQGWTHEQAAGIVGNLMAESGHGLEPGASGDGGAASGIAQWHPARQALFEQHMGIPVGQATRKQQLEFVNWELNNTELGAGKKLKSAKTAAEAAAIVDQFYERSSGQHRSRRISNAEAVANQRG